MTREAQLLTVKLDEATDPALLAAYREILTPEERARGDRYLPARRRHEHVVAHALKRLTLGRMLGAPPRSLEFVDGQYGKPALVGATRLRFNLTHTDGLVALLVCDGAEVGVDAENVGRPTDTLPIAERFFAEPEVRDLHALYAGDQTGRFFEIWTLKESYLKACGAGLNLPLGSFWFHLGDGHDPRVSFGPPIVDDPARWRFFQGWLDPCWRLAAAVEAGGETPRLTIAASEVPRP